ncbi:undecaprenyl-phosphate glucose phosphotransferase [Pseudomonas sp. HLMP]|uniref:undecaprenyl-phosphate glucose phosphotransferase n=1 Tax=Pseudomonas sp. HLMP TaxID=3153767 RepID=UPI003967016D
MRAAPKYQPTFAERYPVSFLFALLDMLIVLGAGLFAHHYRFQSFEMTGRYSMATMITAIVVVVCLAFVGVYGSQRGRSFWQQLGFLVVSWACAAGALLSLSFFLKVSENYSRIWFSVMLLVGAGLCVMLRFAIYMFLRKIRSSGFNLKSILLVDSGRQLMSQFGGRKTLEEDGFHVVSRLAFDKEDQSWEKKLVEQVEKLGVHEVWLCLPLNQGGQIKSILYALRNHTVAVRFIPDWEDMRLLNHKVSYVAGNYAIDLSCSPIDGPARVVKRMEDLIVGGLISVLILPVCIFIAIAVRISSPGPVLFKQHRTGINGKKFKVYKFRSMVVHRESGVTQAARNDARVTKVGAFLRRTSLDELPQFFNVLQGRMSIVGPRPHALSHNEYYKDLVESYMQRHKVKPGITGWAQVSGYRGETDTLEKMEKRVEYDLWYIDNWSLWLDLRIIFMTVFKGFINKNAY